MMMSSGGESLYDLLNEGEEEGQPSSDKAGSEASEKLLAQVREQFKKKEVVYKQKISRLTEKIGIASEKAREK